MAASRTPQRGFTLVEMIVVIVVMGILAGMVAIFIRAPMQGYVDSAARADTSDVASLSLRRMARDIRLALPNSIRTIGSDGHAVEFLLTKAGGRYLAAEDAEATTSNGEKILEFEKASNPNINEFTVVGAMPSLNQNVASNDYVVVYNLGPGFAPADAYQLGSTNRNIAMVLAPVTDASGNVTSIKLTSNPFVTQTPPMPSPTHRFQVVSGPVTYRCALGNGVYTLTRYWSYPINAVAADPPSGGKSAVIASNLASCDQLFRYTASVNNRRTGLVTMSLSLKVGDAGASVVTLVDQVHVDNTP